jgi:hypothetical protein
MVPEGVPAPDGGLPSGARPHPPAPASAPAPPSVQRAMPVAANASSPPQRPAPADGLVDAGAVAVAAGVAQRMPDGSVVFRTPASTTTPPPPAMAVQRQEEEAVNDPEPLSEPPPEPPGAESTPGVGDPAAASAAVPPAADGSAGENGAPAVSEEMVRALYAPLSRMLRAELRLERERAGFLINTRH